MLALALLVLLAYRNSVTGGLHFDDTGVMLKDPYITGPGFGWEIFRLEQTRPLTYLTFHWNHLAHGANPWGYHVVNVLLHGGNSILVLLIALHSLPAPAAFFAASLFAVHPLSTEAVNYVFQRATLLAACFALLSFLLFLRHRYAWSVAVFGLSLLAKEETMALPAFVLLYDLASRGKRPLRPGYHMALFALSGLAIARLVYALQVVPVTRPGIGLNVAGISPVTYLLTQARVVWKYLGLFAVPVDLNLDHDVELSRSLISPWSTLPAALGLAAVIATLAWLTWRRNLLSNSRTTKAGGSFLCIMRRPPASVRLPALWALGFFVLLAPSSSVIPVIDLMFEHRTYFPLACAVIAAAWVWGRLPHRVFAWTGAALLAAALAGTIVRNRAWHDEESLWTATVEKSPRKVRAYMNLSMVYRDKQPARSRPLLEQVLLLDPNNADAHSLLGDILNRLNEPGSALPHLQRAMALRGETAGEWNNIGTAHARLGQLEEAVQDYRRALELQPCLQAPRLNLTSTLATLGDRAQARVEGLVPPGCPYTPDDARELEDYRRTL